MSAKSQHVMTIFYVERLLALLMGSILILLLFRRNRVMPLLSKRHSLLALDYDSSAYALLFLWHSDGDETRLYMCLVIGSGASRGTLL